MGARILVVNDTPEILDAFRDLLEGEGYEVVLRGVAFQRVDDVVRARPDLIILDYLFGREKLGWQMLQLLHMNRATARIPIIVCTAATREVLEIENDLFNLGVRLVHKPFDIDVLLRIVGEALAAPSTTVAPSAGGPDEPHGDDDLHGRRKGRAG